jgi:hypothetical protein
MTRQLRAHATAAIPAPAARVYAILCDYRGSHPRILPKDFFTGLAIESGGQGTGTILRVRARILGAERELRMHVDEPEPGRVLRETDRTSGLVTTFTVQPMAVDICEVTIATRWTAQPGITGLIESWLVPRTFQKVYRKELALLAQVAAE